MYDGEIDTRACDYSQGFICHGDEIDPILYSGYRLPLDNDDGWVNLFQKDISLSDWKLSIYPDKEADYAWDESIQQINPYIQIMIHNKLYGEVRETRLRGESIQDFQITLQTLFNTRGHYIQTP
ncbi:MAG: hypothetical protein GXP45_02235 [bacterium]|nr:hypothetical protein [bacterium]